MNSAAGKKVDGTYTRMLRRVKNISWRDRPVIWSNSKVVYPNQKKTVAGHVARHNEPAETLLFRTPEECRRRNRPNITLKEVLHEDTGLTSNKLRTAMADRQIWRKITSCHRNENRKHYY